MEVKSCSRCKKIKPLTEFNLRSKRESVPKSACKDCHRERARWYWKKKPLPKEVQREKNLQKAFGISVNDYDRLLESQDGLCAICGRPESDFTRRLAVDHNHETGSVRGLLCMFCNTGLGMFQDNIELLEKAKQYLIDRR